MLLQIEVRANGTVNISGYVNATEKRSNPVITPYGKAIEVIQPKAFEMAIERADNIYLDVDHYGKNYADTKTGTLKLYEDNIGLHADVTITDPELIDLAKQGKIKGWSFGMLNIIDSLETTGELPVRLIESLDLEHISLIILKTPVYSATSVEVRAGENTEIETRGTFSNVQLTDNLLIDNSAFITRLKALQKK